MAKIDRNDFSVGQNFCFEDIAMFRSVTYSVRMCAFCSRFICSYYSFLLSFRWLKMVESFFFVIFHCHHFHILLMDLRVAYFVWISFVYVVCIKLNVLSICCSFSVLVTGLSDCKPYKTRSLLLFIGPVSMKWNCARATINATENLCESTKALTLTD